MPQAALRQPRTKLESLPSSPRVAARKPIFRARLRCHLSSTARHDTRAPHELGFRSLPHRSAAAPPLAAMRRPRYSGQPGTSAFLQDVEEEAADGRTEGQTRTRMDGMDGAAIGETRENGLEGKVTDERANERAAVLPQR